MLTAIAVNAVSGGTSPRPEARGSGTVAVERSLSESDASKNVGQRSMADGESDGFVDEPEQRAAESRSDLGKPNGDYVGLTKEPKCTVRDTSVWEEFGRRVIAEAFLRREVATMSAEQKKVTFESESFPSEKYYDTPETELTSMWIDNPPQFVATTKEVHLPADTVVMFESMGYTEIWFKKIDVSNLQLEVEEAAFDELVVIDTDVDEPGDAYITVAAGCRVWFKFDDDASSVCGLDDRDTTICSTGSGDLMICDNFILPIVSFCDGVSAVTSGRPDVMPLDKWFEREDERFDRWFAATMDQTWHR